MKEKIKLPAGRGKYLLIGAGLLIGILLLVAGNFDADRLDQTAVGEAISAEEYCEMLEKRLVILLSAVEGAGEVRVMVSLESGYRSVYEKDGEGVPVTVGSGSSESAVLVTEGAPAIGGVGVVCQGAKNDRVKREVVALISATLGVGTHKIYVTS